MGVISHVPWSDSASTEKGNNLLKVVVKYTFVHWFAHYIKKYIVCARNCVQDTGEPEIKHSPRPQGAGRLNGVVSQQRRCRGAGRAPAPWKAKGKEELHRDL